MTEPNAPQIQTDHKQAEISNGVNPNHQHLPMNLSTPDEILNDQLADQVMDEKEAIVVIDDAIVRALPWKGEQIIY